MKATTWHRVAGSHLGCDAAIMLDLLYLFIFGKVNLCKRHRAKGPGKMHRNRRNFWAVCTERMFYQNAQK